MRLIEMNVIKHLEEIGLNHNEALIYTSLLNSGPTTVLLLANISGIKRSTVYNTIESLLGKGLVHYEINGTKKLLVAENPEELGLMLARQKQKLDAVLPRLHALHTTTRPSESLMKQFYGLQGVRTVYSHLLEDLKENDEYLVISNQDKWFELDPEFFEHFIKKRSKLSLNTRLLLQNTAQTREFKHRQAHYNEIIKLFPEHVALNINMVITSCKTVIMQLSQPIFIILIENKNMADMNRTLFDLLWTIF